MDIKTISKSKNHYIERFLFISFIEISLFYFIYNLFRSIFLFSIDFSKGLGFIIGTIFVYFAHKNFTFKIKENNLIFPSKFILLYLFNFFLSVYLNSLFLYLIDFIQKDIIGLTYDYILKFDISKYASFIITTILCVLFRFLGLRYWIYYKIFSSSKGQSNEKN